MSGCYALEIICFLHLYLRLNDYFCVTAKFLGGSQRSLFAIFGRQVVCQATSGAAGKIHLIILFFQTVGMAAA